MMKTSLATINTAGVFTFMANESEVYAKFADRCGVRTLAQHISDCLAVMASLRSTYRDLPQRCGNPRLYELLFYAVVLHDFGKAAQGWQEQWTKGTKPDWGYRHEILSAAFVDHLDLPELDRHAIALAVYTHHMGLEKLNKQYAAVRSEQGDRITTESFQEKQDELRYGWLGLQRIWELIPRWAADYLERPHALLYPHLDRRRLVNAYQKYLDDGVGDQVASRQLELIWLRGMLEICDHLGSGCEKGVLTHERPFAEGFRHGGMETFVQRQMRAVDGSCCVISPTGTGKTEAALLWADRNYGDRPGARTIFVLPYTASINAMYRRLLEVVGDQASVAMLHGRALDYLYQSLLNSDASDAPLRLQTAKRMYRDARELYAAHKVVTPHQILMGLFGLRGFEKRLVELTDALIIVDELHAYDPEMMARVIFMLETAITRFGARVCMMSATFPEFLRRLVCERLGIAPANVIRAEKADLPPPRHRIITLEGTWENHLSRIETMIGDGGRVLVVCNTVRSAVAAFRRMRGCVGDDEALLLHSRFTVQDRAAKERVLREKRLLVATQVVEVSLDISFDALLSEPAPIDALVQRFGRVNRKNQDKWQPAPCCVLSAEWPRETPVYDAKRRERTLAELRELQTIGAGPDETMIWNAIERVYEEGYSATEWQQFQMVYNSFAKVFPTLAAGQHDDHATEQYRKLIEAETVVPMCYRGAHQELVAQKRFIDARQWEASLSRGAYWQAKAAGRIMSVGHWEYVDLPYSSEFGLEADDWHE